MLNTDYLDANRPNWRTEPVGDVVTWSRTEVDIPDPTRRDTVFLMNRLSIADATETFETVEAAAVTNALVKEAWRQLQGGGIELSHTSTVALINTLFAGNTSLRDTLIALGRRTKSYRDETQNLTAWEAAGGVPTQDDFSREQAILDTRAL